MTASRGRPALCAKDSLGRAERIVWHYADRPEVSKEYYTIVGDDGITWLFDGDRWIAALPSRMFRFYREGIARRCSGLTDRYLRGLVPVGHGDVVVNFGANVGEVAMTLAERGASVLAIEPDPNVLPILTANVRGRSIQIVGAAAWDSDGELEMYIASESADTSAFNVSDHRQKVPSVRIDTLARGLNHIALIVGDAEGGEPEVLRGATGALSITDYVSVCASAERCGEKTLDPCESILAKAGFDIIHREDKGFCILIAKRRI